MAFIDFKAALDTLNATLGTSLIVEADVGYARNDCPRDVSPIVFIINAVKFFGEATLTHFRTMSPPQVSSGHDYCQQLASHRLLPHLLYMAMKCCSNP